MQPSDFHADTLKDIHPALKLRARNSILKYDAYKKTKLLPMQDPCLTFASICAHNRWTLSICWQCGQPANLRALVQQYPAASLAEQLSSKGKYSEAEKYKLQHYCIIDSYLTLQESANLSRGCAASIRALRPSWPFLLMRDKLNGNPVIGESGSSETELHTIFIYFN
jgi:hypothetical protein